MSTAGLAVVCGHRTKVAAGGCLGSGEVGTSSRDAVAATGTLRRFAAVRKHSSQGTATVASVLPGCGRKADVRDSDLLPVRFAFEITANRFPPSAGQGDNDVVVSCFGRIGSCLPDHEWDAGCASERRVDRVRRSSLDRLRIHGASAHSDAATGSAGSRGLVFRRGYVPSSLCCPSLASLITGKYPHQHKIANNDPPGGSKNKGTFAAGRETMSRFMDAQPTLPRLLTQAGYLTLQTGKWWQGEFTRGGFTHGMTKGQRHGDEGLDIGRKTMQPIDDFIGEARKQDKPFFVWYAPMLPHTPHNPPQRLFDKYKSLTKSEHVARYWAMCEFFDETCGQLLDHLAEQKLAENTIVIYVTDNGWIQDPDKPQYAPKSKQSQYDGGLRTPIMVRWPGKVAPRMSDVPISSLDILPTVLEAVGLQRPAELPGLNLLDEAAVARRETVFGECFTHDSRDLQNPAASLRWRWLVRQLEVDRAHFSERAQWPG